MSTEHIPPKLRLKKSWLAAIAALIVIAAIIAVLPYFRSAETTIPTTLGDLRLTKEIRGNEAKAIINQMHGKGVTPTDNMIGVYTSSKGTATIYLSEYDTPAQAEETSRQMVHGIEKGTSPFSDFKKLEFYSSSGRNLACVCNNEKVNGRGRGCRDIHVLSCGKVHIKVIVHC